MADIKNETWLKSLCRSYTEANVKTLAGWATGDNINEDLKMRAIGMLMDRGWGKAVQPQDVKAEVSGAMEIIIRDIAAEKAKAG